MSTGYGASMTTDSPTPARRRFFPLALSAVVCLALGFPGTPLATADPTGSPSPTPSPSISPAPSQEPGIPSAAPTQSPSEDPAPSPQPSPGVSPVEGSERPSIEPEPAQPNTAPQGIEPQATYEPPPTRNLPGVYVTGGTQVGHGWNPKRTIFPGDWNRDNTSDLMLVTDSGDLLFYRTLMPDTFTPPVTIGRNWHHAIEVLGGADWDNDGNNDLLGRFSDGTLHFYQGNGRGGFLGQRQIGRNWNNFLEIAIIKNGPNGRPALVGLRNDYNSFVYTSSWRLEFTVTHSAIDWAGFRNLVGTGDWDNNGKGDLLAIDRSNTLRYLAADSSGLHFSHYKVGQGWQDMSRIQSARVHGRSYVFAMSYDGKLYNYSLVNNERVSDPAPRVDSRCLTGRVMCASKSDRILHWIVDGQILASLDARFGKPSTPSDNGAFRVTWKSRYHVSTIYHTPMPWAMFYNGGEAVHYSSNFAQVGWRGGSGGCVNVRDAKTIDWLYGQVRVGDQVVVYE